MKLTLRESRYLKDSISIISELVTEANIKVAGDRLELVAMDPANVSMVIFKILSSAFSDYEIDGEKFIRINLSSFGQVLKRAKASDVVMLELDEEMNRLVVRIRGETNRDFSLGLLEVDEAEQKIPNLKYNARVETNNVLFNEAVEDMEIISDSLHLKLIADSFIVEAEGSTSSGRVVFRIDQNTDIVNSEGAEIKAKYSTEYMKKIIKGAKLSNSVTLQFANDYPLSAEYKVIDRLSLMFILAPRRSTTD